jgi:hypothetical protein
VILLASIVHEAINPALALLPPRMDTAEARIQLLATGLQESRFMYRRQKYQGPAMGFWQFERGGGVKGVLTHKASKALAIELCKVRDVEPLATPVWEALERDDVLAAGFARLLLFTDPQALPAIGNAAGAWEYYLRNWRPGKPHRQTWDEFYRQAKEQVTEVSH